MRRREFIGLVAGVASWPLAGRAQHASVPVVGFLSSRSPGESAKVLAAFHEGLKEHGFVEGRNVVIAFRWAEGNYERLAGLASDLVRMRVAVICSAGGPPSAFAAQKATSTIPIVFPGAGDPVKLGLVASLNRPGANITGINNFSVEVAGKSVEILKELLPDVGAIGYLVNPSNPGFEGYSREVLNAAQRLGIQVQVFHASTVTELDRAFESMSQRRVRAFVITGEPFFDGQREKIVALSARHQLAGCYPWREYVSAGGLLSYGASLPDAYRLAGLYVARILKGEKPADLPVVQPTKLVLAINLKTAKALGLTVSPTLLARADEVIE
jgi:putative ABC transport system substrate-binding protein